MRREKPELGLEPGAARTVLSSTKRVNTNPPRPVQGTAPRTCYNQDAGCCPQSASSPEPLPSSTRTQPCCFIPTRSATISQTPSVVLARSFTRFSVPLSSSSPPSSALDFHHPSYSYLHLLLEYYRSPPPPDSHRPL